MAKSCYNIGDVGPAGGIIFALPFTGINQTKFYYEISLDDIETAGTVTLDGGAGVTPPVGVPALTVTGTEFGAWKQNISTSPAFGDGKKNTDILDALPIFANSNPTIATRDLAAKQCKQYAITGPDGKDYNDWFLPSREEIEEAYNAVGAASLNLGGFPLRPRWTSTSNSQNVFTATIAILVDQATPVIAPTFNTQADRSLPYAIRPIRRFVCKDKGITYDYRIDTFGLPCAGNIDTISIDSFISQNITTSFTIDAYAFSMLNSSTNQLGLVIFSNSDFVIAVDSTTVSSLPAIGSQFGLVGNVPYNLLGSVVDVIDIATHPQLGVNLPSYQAIAGANVDTFIVFNPSSNFSGPNGVFIGQNYPFLSFIDTLSYNVISPNPAYSPPIFGSIYEIGHSNLMIQGMSRQDVRLNDVVGLSLNDRIETRVGEIFNIKIYSQYEELIGDWDYKLTNARNGFGCCISWCFKTLQLKLSQTNYVNPSFSSDPNIVDIKVYHEGVGVAGHPEGWAYVAITCVTDNTFNSNFVRGNTLNLKNWLGTTQNNRTKNTSFPISGMQWKWQKEVCGYHTGGDHCCGGSCGRYHAEVNPPQFNLYCNNFNNAVPNHTVLFNNKQECIGRSSTATNNSSAKLTSPSLEYGDEVNECFENGIEEVEVNIYSIVEENQSPRQRFANRIKIQEETGPFGISGYYPLYDTIEAARLNSPTFFARKNEGDTYGYHIHEFGGVEYYMPNGLEMGVTQFHGDWDGVEIIEYSSTFQTLEPQVTVEEEQQEVPEEQPSTVIITPQPEKLPQQITQPQPQQQITSSSGNEIKKREQLSSLLLFI